jgi:glycogen debranching enzyme
MSGWNADVLAQAAGIGAITILEGSSFSVSSSSGDMDVRHPHGLFFQDMRLLSTWILVVDGTVVEPLTAMTPSPYRALFVGRSGSTPDKQARGIVVERDRRVGVGLREDLTLRNYSSHPVDCAIDVLYSADFADIFDVKNGRPIQRPSRVVSMVDDTLVRQADLPYETIGVKFHAADGVIDDKALHFSITIPARGAVTRSMSVTPELEGKTFPADFPLGHPLEASPPQRRLESWRRNSPTGHFAHEAHARTFARSQSDLGSLRIFRADHPNEAVIAAGAPWFMALFGRDSLLTSLMALPVDPNLAFGTLRTLAQLQGTAVNPQTEEQPGRILHEVRMDVGTGHALGGGNVYYGSIDSTPLFVIALAELSRWGLGDDEVISLLPNADAALRWVEEFGDRDGDGFVEYERLNDHGLLNQGWKDSVDGINFRDGSLAVPPIALCEVQGYVYRAYLSRALIARRLGDPSGVARWSAKAARLKKAFNKQFWLADRGYFAIALDADKRPVDSCASNQGQCLWSGIVDDDKAPLVAERLMSPEMFTGWGIRTLASDMGAFNPTSYHNGAVWPHDNALIAAGLMRYGLVEEATRVAVALFDVAERFGSRLPELFCGMDREHYPEPVPYPTSCSPQAWAAATPFSLMRTLFRFEPCVPTDEIWLAPMIPAGFGAVQFENVPFAGARLSIHAKGTQFELNGLPKQFTLHLGPRGGSADTADLCW